MPCRISRSESAGASAGKRTFRWEKRGGSRRRCCPLCRSCGSLIQSFAARSSARAKRPCRWVPILLRSRASRNSAWACGTASGLLRSRSASRRSMPRGRRIRACCPRARRRTGPCGRECRPRCCAACGRAAAISPLSAINPPSPPSRGSGRSWVIPQSLCWKRMGRI